MSQIVDGVKHLNERWKAESPALFKKINVISTSMIATAGAIFTPDMAGIPPEKFHMPTILTQVAGYMLALGLGGRFVSKLTCQDPTKLDKSDNPNEQIPKQ